MRSRPISRLLGLALALVAMGCAGTVHSVRTYPAPGAEELMAALKARQGAVRVPSVGRVARDLAGIVLPVEPNPSLGALGGFGFGDGPGHAHERR